MILWTDQGAWYTCTVGVLAPSPRASAEAIVRGILTRALGCAAGACKWLVNIGRRVVDPAQDIVHNDPSHLRVAIANDALRLPDGLSQHQL